MLLRKSLILAIVASLAVGGLAYYQRTVQIPALVQQRDAEKLEKASEVAALDRTKAELARTTAALNQCKQELADARIDEKKMLARADAQQQRADVLQGKLAGSNADLQSAQNLLVEYKASGLKPDEVVKLKNDLVTAQRQVAKLGAKCDELQAAYARVHEYLVKEGFGDGPDGYFLPYGLQGNIVAVDPKWNFVVVGIGENQGVFPECEMLVSRQGKLVGKVVISKVEKDRCIANVVPGWQLGEIMEGDVVTPAHPASS